MMRIERHEQGNASGPVEPVYLNGHCPRCGICDECRDEVKAELRRDQGLERAMARGAYRRGMTNGVQRTLLFGALALFVLWLAWEVYRV